MTEVTNAMIEAGRKAEMENNLALTPAGIYAVIYIAMEAERTKGDLPLSEHKLLNETILCMARLEARIAQMDTPITGLAGEVMPAHGNQLISLQIRVKRLEERLAMRLGNTR